MGELELRNPAVMLGYWGMPEETANVLADGWLRTGDLVTADPDGTYTFVGRGKEVIRRRGENLAPAEVEEALASHPDVVEAAVVGVPSELSEEEVKAFVVAAPGPPTWPRSGRTRPRCWRRSRCPATSRPSTSSRTPRPAGSPSTSSPSERSGAEIDFEPPRASAPATERTT